MRPTTRIASSERVNVFCRDLVVKKISFFSRAGGQAIHKKSFVRVVASSFHLPSVVHQPGHLWLLESRGSHNLNSRHQPFGGGIG